MHNIQLISAADILIHTERSNQIFTKMTAIMTTNKYAHALKHSVSFNFNRLIFGIIPGQVIPDKGRSPNVNFWESL